MSYCHTGVEFVSCHGSFSNLNQVEAAVSKQVDGVIRCLKGWEVHPQLLLPSCQRVLELNKTFHEHQLFSSCAETQIVQIAPVC